MGEGERDRERRPAARTERALSIGLEALLLDGPSMGELSLEVRGELGVEARVDRELGELEGGSQWDRRVSVTGIPISACMT